MWRPVPIVISRIAMFDAEKYRSEFPGLNRKLYGRDMVYFDNVATTQTPRRVVDAIANGYYHAKANVHRGVHTLSQEATALQEETRRMIRDWLNAESESEIIFTRGTTESINLVAASFGQLLSPGDEIILTEMEHHANIVPWQLLASRMGLTIKVVRINKAGVLDLDEYESLFSSRTRIVAFAHVSNVLGTVNPVRRMTDIAHAHGCVALVDGAQAVGHMRPDVVALGADFYAFSFHKMYGPTGVGVLYGRRNLLEKMPPYQGGGEMIGHVSFSGTTFAELPYKFEAGTPDFVGIGAAASALNFIKEAGIEAIADYEHQLLEYATARMLEIPGVIIYGKAPRKGPVISFNLGEHHPYDVGMLLDKQAIEVRTGHHCAQPLMHALGIEGTVRIGFALYNTRDEIDHFILALQRTAEILG